MQDKPTVGLYLDTRRAIDNGKYPIKVRVTWEIMSKGTRSYTVKYFHTKQYATEKEFATIESGKSLGKLRDVQDKVFAARAKAIMIIEQNNRIKVNDFIVQYGGKVVSNANLYRLFQDVIDEKKRIEKIGTAKFYQDAQSSFKAYAGEFTDISEIDKEWLENYERSEVKKGNSLNTASAYLRALRSIFNLAMERKLISMDSYPFGKKQFSIRRKRVKKKPIPESVKDKIVAYKPENEAEAMALDYSLFSYYCNGMNLADMAHLKVKNFKTDHFVFIRRKSKDTVHEQKEIKVYLSDTIKDILKRRGNHKPYVFGIINDNMSAEEMHKKIQQWNKTTSKWLRVIASKVGYHERVSTAVLRHTFTSILINAGVPITKVKDSLGHTTITTTQDYAEDLDLNTSKKFSELL